MNRDLFEKKPLIKDREVLRGYSYSNKIGVSECCVNAFVIREQQDEEKRAKGNSRSGTKSTTNS